MKLFNIVVDLGRLYKPTLSEMEQWSLPNDLAHVRVTGKHAAFVFCIVLRRRWPPCLLSVSCFHLFVFFYSMFSAVLFVFCLLHCSSEGVTWPTCLFSVSYFLFCIFLFSFYFLRLSSALFLGGGDHHVCSLFLVSCFLFLVFFYFMFSAVLFSVFCIVLGRRWPPCLLLLLVSVFHF